MGFNYSTSTMHVPLPSQQRTNGAAWSAESAALRKNVGGTSILLPMPECSGAIRCCGESHPHETCNAPKTAVLLLASLVWCQVQQKDIVVDKESACTNALDNFPES